MLVVSADGDAMVARIGIMQILRAGKPTNQSRAKSR